METNRDYKEGIGGFKTFLRITDIRLWRKNFTFTSLGDGN